MKKPSFLNFSEEQNQSRKNTVQNLLAAGAVGGLGYAGYKNFLNSPAEITKALTGLNAPTELRQAGEEIGKELRASKEILEASRRVELDEFVQKINSQLDNILNKTDNVAPEERRAFFASFFETVKNEQIDAGIKTDDLLKQAYDDVKSLNDTQKAVLTDMFNMQIKGSEKASKRFNKAYAKYSSNMNLFAESTKRNIPSGIPGSNIKRNVTTIPTEIQNKYNDIINLARGSNYTVSLDEVDEGGKVKGLYARFTRSAGQSETLVLRAGTDSFGNPIIRAGENLQTRYVAPLKVLNAPAMIDSRTMRSINAGTLKQAMGNGIITDYSDYVFNLFKSQVGGSTGFANLDRNVFSKFNQLITASTMYAPSEAGNLSSASKAAIGASRKLFSSSFLISGLEQFDPGKRGQVNKILLEAFPQDFAGVSSVQTMTRDYENPFMRGSNLSFAKLGYAGEDITDYASPFKYLKFYGRNSIDRAVQKQTAREYQMIGREETVLEMKGINSFGVGGKIKAAGSGSELIGINSKYSGGGRALNLGTVVFKNRVANKLGLAEGVAYLGGTVVNESISTLTVNQNVGIAETNLLQKLKAGQIKVGEGGDYSIDDFFNLFGNNKGEVVLGETDTGLTTIKRQGGVTSFQLELYDEGKGSRPNYKIRKTSQIENRNTKLFGPATKDTTEKITKAQLEERLKKANAESFSNLYFGDTVGGKINSTLVVSSAQLKKSSIYFSNFMVGGFAQIGGNIDELEKEIGKRIGKDEDYLNLINKIYGTKYKNLNEAQDSYRAGAQLIATAESLIKKGSEAKLGSKELGHIIGILEDSIGDKFSMTKDMFENLIKDQDDVFQAAARSNIAFGVTHATTGGIHSELKRNLARMEPRAFNYMYTSLRSNMGLSADEAKKYMASLIGRMESSTEKSLILPGMTAAQFSLSPMNEMEFSKYVSSIGNIGAMDAADVAKLFSLGQGNEAEVIEILSKYNQGSTIDLKKVISDPQKLKVISEMLGGRTSLFFGGAQVFDNLSGFSLKSGEELLNIESEYNRSVTDLITSISSIRDSRSDTELSNRTQQFKYAKKYMADITGKTIRQSLSGQVSGSGSYMGAGIILGNSKANSTLVSNNITDIKGLTEAFEKNKGYVVFQDAQAFLDGMTTYRDGLKGENKDKAVARRVRQFFLGMHTTDKEAVTAMVMRNPNINFTHFLPGMGLMRYDFNRGNQDQFFEMFRGRPIPLINYDRINKINEQLKGKYNPETREYAGKGLFDEQKEERKKRLKKIKATRKKHFAKLNIMNPANIRRLLYAHLSETGISEEYTRDQLKEIFGDRYDSLRTRSQEALKREQAYLKTQEDKIKLEKEKLKDPAGDLEKKKVEAEKILKRLENAPNKKTKRKEKAKKKQIEKQKTQIANIDKKLAEPKMQSASNTVKAELAKVDNQLKEIIKKQKELSLKNYSVTKRAIHDSLMDYYDEIFSGTSAGRTQNQKSFLRKLSKFSDIDLDKDVHVMYRNRAYKDATITYFDKEVTKAIQKKGATRIFAGSKLLPLEEVYDSPASILYQERYKLSHRQKISTAIMQMLNKNKGNKVQNIDLFQSLIGDNYGRGFLDLEYERYNPETKASSTVTKTFYNNPLTRKIKEKLARINKHLELPVDAEGKLIYPPNSPEIQALLDEKAALLDPNNLNNKIEGDRLNILERQLKLNKGSLTSFEDIAKLYEQKSSETIKSKSGKNITVGEQLDKYFASMLRHHQNFGEVGGGRIYFPQIDVEGTLKSGDKSFKFSERIDFSRMMIGDFDADYYQVFHDTNTFNKNAADHFGLYKAGGEYLIHKQLLGEGMAQLGKRLGIGEISIGQSVLDEYQKEKIIKEVGGLDVQVKIGMLGAIRAAEENSLRTGGKEYMSESMRSVSSLVAVAQEVLAIKGKSLPTAANVAEAFNTSLKESYKTGKGDAIFNFFQENVFKGTLLETKDKIKFSDIDFVNLDESLKTTKELRRSLMDIEIDTSTFKRHLDEMAFNVKKYGLGALGSDTRSGSALMSGDIASIQLMNRLLSASAEGGLFNSSGNFDQNQLERISRDVSGGFNQIFTKTAPRNFAGLIAGVLGGSYLLGATSNVSSLQLSEENFSDIRASQNIGNKHVSQMFVNRDHNGSISSLSNSGYDSTFYQRPINQGETMVIKNNRTRFYGEAATQSEAMGSAHRFASAGGKAFVGIQDNRMPISNSYIANSLRD